MNCAVAQELVHGYLDQELDPMHAIEIDRHLESCAPCRQLHDQQRSLHSVLRREASYHAAPAEMRDRIRAAIDHRAPRPRRAQTSWWDWWTQKPSLIGVGVAAAVVFSVSAALNLSQPNPDDRLTDEIVSSHVRSLMVNHLADVASSDHHTVKPWFNGKLAYSPPVDDLAARGFPLIGGRLDYLNDQPIAALVYRDRLHVINVFVRPETNGRDERPRAESRQGYNLVRWARRGMEFWAVTDLNMAELKQFAEAMSEAPLQTTP